MKGLTSSQAAAFLNRYGLNVISEPIKKNILSKIFEQFKDFLTILLIVAAVLSFLIGEKVDAGLIIVIVILNAFFGLYQEGKAEESLAALKKMTVTKVRVIRDGREIEVDSKYLVPGDLIYLEEGVKISADGEIIKSFNLQVNESSLTGESIPVSKNEKEIVYSGTIVASGRGYVIVKNTGDKTKFGEIAKNLSTIKDEETPLAKKLENLTRIIGIGGIILAVLVFLISLVEGTGYFPAFLLSVSLAVAVVPEGLPAVMTITLAIGMKKMASKKTILKKLSAIEALGSITLIATDKTGTLTTNKMQVAEIYINNNQYPISDFQTNFKLSSTDLKNNGANLLVLDGLICSTASLVYVHDHGSYDVLGDPTEGAMLFLAQKMGLDYAEIRKNWQIIDEKPFDSVSKMMSVSVKNVENGLKPFRTMVFSKGAPESIINVCDKILINNKEEKLTEEKRKGLEKQVTKWAEKGLRILAFGYNNYNDYNRYKNYIFLGLVAIHDAPRPEVKKAIEKAKMAGIKVVMITGDNEKTAEAVATTCGLITEGDEILTGVQIEEYSDEELLNILPRVMIFARTNPFQKHRIVKLYQKLGEVVAVTGDGVNDTLALKQADVGIAMGQVGTDVARETADMVITDDNFATIIIAIEEGRSIINNIKNSIKYLLSCNVSEAMSLLIGLILGLPTLFYPIQLLYINLVTDGVPALILSFSPRDPRIMNISPQKEMILLKKKDQSYIILVGLAGSIIVIVSYFLFGQNLQYTAAFSVLTLIQSFIFIDLWLSHRHIHENLKHLASPLFLLGFLLPIILQYIILSHYVSASLFRVSPVSIFIYGGFLGMSFLILVVIRLIKTIVRI